MELVDLQSYNSGHFSWHYNKEKEKIRPKQGKSNLALSVSKSYTDEVIMIPAKYPKRFFAVVPVKYIDGWRWALVEAFAGKYCPRTMGTIARILWYLLRKIEKVDNTERKDWKE